MDNSSHLQTLKSDVEEIFTLKLPPNFYARLSTEVKPNTRFLLWWERCGDELMIRFKPEGHSGYHETDTEWMIWIELIELNLTHDFESYGSSDETPKYFLCHIGYGTFKRVPYFP